MIHENILSTIGNTPLVKINKLVSNDDAEISYSVYVRHGAITGYVMPPVSGDYPDTVGAQAPPERGRRDCPVPVPGRPGANRPGH